MLAKERKRSYDLSVYTSVFSLPNSWSKPIRHSNSKVGQWTESRITNPEKIEDYRLLIARHNGATTSLFGTRYDTRGFTSAGQIEYTGIRVSNGKQEEGVKISGSLAAHVSALTTPGFGANSLQHVPVWALAGFAKKCYKAQNTLQGVVCLGELGETVRGIRSPLKALFGGLKDYLKAAERAAHKAKRRGGRLLPPSPSRTKAVTKAIAGTWLESVFGWLPLVSDIDDAAKALARIVTYRPPVQHVSFKAGDEQVGTPIKQSVSYGAAVIVSTVAEKRVQLEAKMYGQLINRNGWDGALQDLGFNWRNWVPSLYQLIPYSFLVDYFSNFGDIIEAATINRALVAWIATGTKKTESVTVNWINASFQASTPLFKRSGSLSPGSQPSCSLVTLERSPYNGSLVPPLAFEIPGLGMQWLNVTALIAQAQATSRRIRA